MTVFADDLNKALTDVNINLDQHKIAMLEQHWQLLIDKNTEVNLTAITEQKAAISKHYLDCLLALPYLPAEGLALDIGSGGGFPGLVLAIAQTQVSWTLVESVNKKAEFLRQAASQLILGNVTVITSRAETLGRQAAFRGKFDLATARAVAGLASLLEYAVPLLKIGGRFIAYKGPDAVVEIEQAANALDILGGQIVDVINLNLPYSGESRSLVLIEKTSETPDKYPRREGMAVKKPL